MSKTAFQNFSNKDDSVWQPAIGATWQIVLSHGIDSTVTPFIPDVEVWDLDLFENSKSTFQKLHAAGKRVVCYFSAGTAERNRADLLQIEANDAGNVLPDWPDEHWLNISSPRVRSIMVDRIKLAASKGCDAIDPDNLDGFTNDTGFDLTKEDAISYVHFLATVARQHNMAIGLKNSPDIVANVLPIVQFSINEECAKNQECQQYNGFIAAGKPVFNIEYIEDDAQCALNISAENTNFSTVVKNLNLDGMVKYPDCNTLDTPLLL